MGRVAVFLGICVFAVSVLCGCSLVRVEEEPRTPLDYTIPDPEKLPAEIVSLMEERKDEGFQMTYQMGDELYLMKGYGRQMTGGYSIRVKEVSESSSSVFFATNLLGPKELRQGDEPSYPFVVVKIAWTEKPVTFEPA